MNDLELAVQTTGDAYRQAKAHLLALKEEYRKNLFEAEQELAAAREPFEAAQAALEASR